MSDRLIGAGAGREGDVEHDFGRVVAMNVVEERHRRPQQIGHVDRLCILARELGVEARGVGDVGDQAVQPPDVVLNYFEPSFARFLILRQRQGFGGAA
jgi:hypothetical protein